jgi:rhodanese-related sulfurtransferase
MKKRIVSLFIALVTSTALGGGWLGCGPAGEEGQGARAEQRFREISADALLARSGGDEMLIVDVRTPDEFASGHVPGAINVPHDQVQSRMAELTPHREQEVVLYCERGGRASKAADLLAQEGFETVFHLSGDMSQWREEGLPIER